MIKSNKQDRTIKNITKKMALQKEFKNYQSIQFNHFNTQDFGIKESFLKKDLILIKKYFLNEFSGVKSRGIRVGGDKGIDWVLFKKFPLPDTFTDKKGKVYKYKPDYEDILFVLSEYPKIPPFGVHIRSKSPNKNLIKKALGHTFNSIPYSGERYEKISDDLSEKGWSWICFHYANDTWNFNTNNIRKGDNLFTYIESLFAFLSGGF